MLVGCELGTKGEREQAVMNRPECYRVFLEGCETHSVRLIEQSIADGLEIDGEVEGRTPLMELMEMYYRSPAFSDCVRCLVERGAECSNPGLLAVLLNEEAGLREALGQEPGLVREVVQQRCAFTPLMGGTLLHVACEYGLLESVRVLVEFGADIEAKASVDAYGLNGHTPIFHTVCQHRNRGLSVLRYLLECGARTDVVLKGMTWGKGFEWETTLFDVTPISYAQAGLYPQFQRDEADVEFNLRLMLGAAGRTVPADLNVPNAYLQKGSRSG